MPMASTLCFQVVIMRWLLYSFVTFLPNSETADILRYEALITKSFAPTRNYQHHYIMDCRLKQAQAALAPAIMVVLNDDR